MWRSTDQYKKLKTIPRCEPYLMISLNHKYRQAIARIRASSHHLGIEMGRQAKPKPIPVDKRICSYCSDNSIDDEYHFILKCKHNSTDRYLLYSKLPQNIIQLCDQEKFVYLLNTQNE